MERLPLALALLILPLAVAGHNIGAGVYSLILLVQIFLRRSARPWRELWAEFKVPMGLSVAYVLWGMIASALNPAAPAFLGGSFAAGYVYWIVLPPLMFMAQARLDAKGARVLELVLAIVVAVMGSVAVAQAIFGFKLSGAHFVPSIKRAQGFYSHPLTFAYVCLFFVPVGWLRALRSPKDPVGWLITCGALAAVYASQSRIVQAATVIWMLAQALISARGRSRVIALVVMGLLATAALSTENRMRHRFLQTLKGPYDAKSAYADDRLAFWDVHRTMFLERPILGHGENLNTAYRTKYYEALGLGDFERKYEAHNTYLQMAVNGGLVGLGLFLAWFAWHFRRAWRLSRESYGAKVALNCMILLAFASLTQNSVQDSEVRYALTLLIAALWLTPGAFGPSAPTR